MAKAAQVICPKYPALKRFVKKDACAAASVRIANTQKKWRLPMACGHCGGWHLDPAR
jgi:hypothetical protein